MPTHEFKCDACGYGFEKFIKVMGRGLPKQCPKCKSRKDFNQILGCPVIAIRGNPTTFGQIAEINSRKLGQEQIQLMEEEKQRNKKKPFTGKLPEGGKLTNRDLSKKSETPWYRDDPKPLDLSKIKDVNKFIMTGKKT